MFRPPGGGDSRVQHGGIPIRFKLLAFVLGTAMAGLGGALYAHLMRFISATDFGFTMSVSMMASVVLGGWGPCGGLCWER